MHGLIFETSVWLLAESTRLLSSGFYVEYLLTTRRLRLQLKSVKLYPTSDRQSFAGSFPWRCTTNVNLFMMNTTIDFQKPSSTCYPLRNMRNLPDCYRNWWNLTLRSWWCRILSSDPDDEHLVHLTFSYKWFVQIFHIVKW